MKPSHFVTICPTLGHGGVVNWSSAFLPAAHHGVPMATPLFQPRGPICPHDRRLPKDHNRPNRITSKRSNKNGWGGRARPAAGRPDRIFRIGFPNAPSARGHRPESRTEQRWTSTRGRRPNRPLSTSVLMARRFAEAGVRFIQCTHSYKWDQHGNNATTARWYGPSHCWSFA